MNYFPEAFLIGAVNEGGFNKISGDRGGRTYIGIAENDWPAWIGWGKIDSWISANGQPHYNKIFTEEEIPGLNTDVQDFYEINFWNKMHGPEILSRIVAIFFYDWFINSKTVATKHIQQILNIEADGVFGSGTIQAINQAGDMLLHSLHQSRNEFYESHVKAVPGDEKFLSGWEKRSDNLYNKLTNS